MNKLIWYIILFSFVLTSCNNQRKLDKQALNKDTIKPKINIKVHKEYDNQGNLISLDSTYTYFYSNIENDSILEQEIFNNFRIDFNNHFKSIDSLFMGDLFFNNPYSIQKFYTPDFFYDNYKFHQMDIENIFKKMDSLKNRFYKDQNKVFKKNSLNQ